VRSPLSIACSKVASPWASRLTTFLQRLLLFWSLLFPPTCFSRDAHRAAKLSSPRHSTIPDRGVPHCFAGPPAPLQLVGVIRAACLGLVRPNRPNRPAITDPLTACCSRTLRVLYLSQHHLPTLPTGNTYLPTNGSNDLPVTRLVSPYSAKRTRASLEALATAALLPTQHAAV
jgi:hypothetical protein